MENTKKPVGKKTTLKTWLLRQMDLAACGCDDIECDAKIIEAETIKRFVFRLPGLTTVYKITEDGLASFRKKVKSSKAFNATIQE